MLKETLQRMLWYNLCYYNVILCVFNLTRSDIRRVLYLCHLPSNICLGSHGFFNVFSLLIRCLFNAASCLGFATQLLCLGFALVRCSLLGTCVGFVRCLLLCGS